MKIKSIVKTIMAVSLIAVSVPTQSAKAQESSLITVKLSNYLGSKTSLPLKVDGTYFLESDSSFALSSLYTLEVENGMFKLYDGTKEANETPIKEFVDSFILKPSEYGTENVLSLDNRRYLGDMEFTIESGKYIRPINTLPMDDYLKSVLPNEMPATWHLEALKAQAVAARSFVLPYVGKVITDTQSHQVYGGYHWQDKAVTAVDETKNEILMYNGKTAPAYYSSSNGGKVESATNAWGSNPTTYGYLKAKKDPFDPQSEYKYEVSEATLIQKFQSKTSTKINTIDSIEVTERTSGEYAEKVTFHVNGNTHHFTVDAENHIRGLLGTSNIKSVNIHRIEKLNNGKFVFQGKGYGHGIGLSQYGAKAMAESNYSYKDILSFYFEGTSLKDNNGSVVPLPLTIPSKGFVEKELTPITDIAPPTEESPNPSTNVQKHTVVKGDTLWSLYKKYNVSIADIQKWNNITDNTIHIGQVLIVSDPSKATPVEEPAPPPVKEEPIVPPVVVPEPKPPVVTPPPTPTPTATKTYTVVKGDTLYGIATKNKVSVDNIKKWNKLSNNIISVGQKLYVADPNTTKPPVVAPVPKPPVVTPAPTTTKTYTVVKGDTLYKVATKNKTTVATIKSLNNLKTDTIKVGQKLIVSKGTTTSNPKPKPPTTVKTTTYKTTANLNLRSTNSTKGSILTTIPKGKEVNYISKSGSWYKVKYGNKTGWVSSEYIKVTTSQETAKVNETPNSTAKTYTVKKGDSLYKIASANKVTVAALKSLNKLKSNVIYIGQKLVVK